MKFLTGFESTHMFGTGTDVLELTRHLDLYEEDLTLLQASGITTFRYSIPWHRIEQVEGIYDWEWMDRAMNVVQRLGLDPILDPLHHTSFPAWLTGGFLNEKFVERYCAFLEACALRYSWVKKYTVINEPFVTALLCGKLGVWHPYNSSNKIFVRMLMNLARVMSLGTRKLTDILGDPVFVHTDPAEVHRSMNAGAREVVSFRNELRFLFLDMMFGKINSSHSLYSFVRKYLSVRELSWLEENPARIHVLGLDYYAHSECEWKSQMGNIQRVWPSEKPVGFAEVAMEYWERYKLPIMLAETNIRGEVTDRIRWLQFMLQECEVLEDMLAQKGGVFEGFSWYPFIDSTDWDSLVREANGNVDPQGIIMLDPSTRWNDDARRVRISSELSEIWARLAKGIITSSREIPSYDFQPGIQEMLKGFPSLDRNKFPKAA